MTKKILIVANWKMNPRTLAEAKTLFNGIKNQASVVRRVDTVLCMPYLFIHPLKGLYKGRKIAFGAQDIFYEPSGPFTGEISPEQLKSFGVEYVIVGHSERRELGETNEMVARKIEAATTSEFKTILCIGERTRDEEGVYLAFLREQIESALRDAPRRYIGNLIIAYEPLWAIGRTASEAVSSHELHQSVLYIKKVISDVLGTKVAHSVQILYGGSVEPSNANDLLQDGEIDGFLIGHASLVKEEFSEILSIADQAKRKK
jgi:triosephosphate isomerase (TIM)